MNALSKRADARTQTLFNVRRRLGHSPLYHIEGSMTWGGGERHPGLDEYKSVELFNGPNNPGRLKACSRFNPGWRGDCLTSQGVTKRAGPVA